MRVEHIIWVVGSKFVYLAELNELFIYALKKKIEQFLNKENNAFNDECDAILQLGSIPWVSKLFLFLNVVVCIKVFVDLPFKKLVYLFLFKKKFSLL